MRKLLVLPLLLTALNADYQTMLFHGHANHLEAHNENGTKFNEMNYGIGYQYAFRNESNHFYTVSGNFITDSYSNPFPFLTAAYNYSLLDGNYGQLSANATAILGLRYSEDRESSKGVFGVVPGFTYKYDKYSVNYNFSPTVDTSTTNGRTTGFHYISLGYEF